MAIRIIKKQITKDELRDIAKEWFGDLVKAAVDIEQEIMAVGGELHVDAEVELVEKERSKNKNIWGINLYPDKKAGEYIEFDSMINIKPASGNRTRGVDSEEVRRKIISVVTSLIQ